MCKRYKGCELKVMSEMELPSNRKFGIFFGFIFAALFVYLYFFRTNSSSASFLLLVALLSLSFFVLGFLRPVILQPLNVLWAKFGMLLGKIVSPIVLGAIFFVIITPTALFLKLKGRDELRLKVDKTKSHWRVREQSEILPDSFINQY